MDTYRVNRYNIAAPCQVTNRLIQGGFRYQKLNLSSPGQITLQNVGVIPTVHTALVTDLPGSFDSSDSSIRDIWAVGARTIQLSEIPKTSIPEFWEVTNEGVLIDSLAPQAAGTPAAITATAYNMAFQVKPLIGGFGFSVLSDTLNSAIYISVDVGLGTITAYLGSTTENQEITMATLPSNATIALGSWQKVYVQVAMNDIVVSINNQQVLAFTQFDKFYGSYGLGTSFGHRAMFKNMVVTDTNGVITYSHTLMDKGCLEDFLLGTNPLDICVDGSRRDRIAYSGDLDVAGSAALVSTHGLEFILGTLKLFGSSQGTPGFFLPTVKIQQGTPDVEPEFNITGLIGYSWNLVTAVCSTYMHTGNVAFAKEWAPKIVEMLEWSDSQTLTNGLFNLTDVSFGGDWNYYDPAQSGIVTKFNVLYAFSLQESLQLLADVGINITVYNARLTALRKAIDTQLWSDDLGAYVYSEKIKNGFGQDSNAIAILAGVNMNPAHSSEIILSTLSRELGTESGPLAFSSGVLQKGFSRYISPYASAYHLRAALSAQNGAVARELLDKLWAPMANAQNENYTGCFWETLDESGRPAFGVTTSLCHGWGAGPTAELSRFVLGAQPTSPGWVEWVVQPQTIGLSEAHGWVPTPRGSLLVSWEFINCLLTMTVEAPVGTKGTVRLPLPLLVPADQTLIIVNGEVTNSTSFMYKAARLLRLLR
jgi:hypothetical protein